MGALASWNEPGRSVEHTGHAHSGPYAVGDRKLPFIFAPSQLSRDRRRNSRFWLICDMGGSSALVR